MKRDIGATATWLPTGQRGSELRKLWKSSKGLPMLPSRVTPPNHHDRAVSADDFEPRASDSPGADVGRAVSRGLHNQPVQREWY